MKLILFGATGMVGQGVLREALNDPGVERLLVIGRRSCNAQHPKLKELIVKDLFDFANFETELVGWDAAIWAIGVSSIGMNETQYAKLTEELTLLWARALLRLNPAFSFCYCSAAGAGGSSMWAKVRQRVEGPLKEMSFKNVGCVRPAFIQPGPGIQSHVKLYQAFIHLMTPLFPWLVKNVPAFFTTSAHLGRAMLRVVQGRADYFILESADINRIGS